MTLTPEEMDQLRYYRNNPDENDILYKEIIKKKLLANNKLIYLLHNEELEQAEAENEDYFGINILPYFLIAPVQHDVQNFICFETAFEDVARYNPVIKEQQIIFYILCHQANNLVQDIGVARHDLIAAEIINEFHGFNDFGTQLVLVSNKPSTTDNDYATRTLIFEQQTPNSMTKYGKAIRNLR